MLDFQGFLSYYSNKPGDVKLSKHMLSMWNMRINQQEAKLQAHLNRHNIRASTLFTQRVYFQLAVITHAE